MVADEGGMAVDGGGLIVVESKRADWSRFTPRSSPSQLTAGSGSEEV